MENLPAVSGSMFLDVQRFEFAQRVGNMLCKATMVPDHFRDNLGNVMIALNFADRVGADPFMVMQSMYIVHGKPGIEGKLVIALLNTSGRFEPLQFEEIGNLRKPENDSDGCIAYATEIKSGKTLKGPLIDWAMVKAEGWIGKNGSKWQTMAPLMFRYRAAAYFARTYCPEVILGMQTREELHDIVDLHQTGESEYYTEPPTEDEIVKVLERREVEQEPPVEPKKDPAGQPDELGEPEKQDAGWDPCENELMARYPAEKAKVIKLVAEEMGIPAEGRLPREVHADILAASVEPESEEETNREDAGESPEEQAAGLLFKNEERWAAIVATRMRQGLQKSTVIRDMTEDDLYACIDEFNAVDNDTF